MPKSIMLRRNWPGPFQRTVRAANGEVIERLTFNPGEPVELTDQQAQACAKDIGHALVLVDLDRDKLRAREDWRETDQTRRAVAGLPPLAEEVSPEDEAAAAEKQAAKEDAAAKKQAAEDKAAAKKKAADDRAKTRTENKK